MSASGPVNPRAHPRIGATKILVRIPDAERFRDFYLRDLSEGGLYVKTQRPLPIGTAVDLELWAPGASEALLLPATVVREGNPAEPPGMGMKFGDLPTESAERLAELIASYQRSPESETLSQVHQLMTELEAARAQVAKLAASESKLKENQAVQEARLRELEQDEVVLRQLAEKVANQKAQLEEKLKREAGEGKKALEERVQALERERDEARTALADLRQANADIESLGADLRKELVEAHDLKEQSEQTVNELRAQLRSVGAERDALKGKGDDQQRVAELQRQLDVERAATAATDAKLKELAQELERRRSAERDLRRLLAAVGGGAGEPTPATPATPSAEPTPAPAKTESSWASSVDEIEIDDEE